MNDTVSILIFPYIVLRELSDNTYIYYIVYHFVDQVMFTVLRSGIFIHVCRSKIPHRICHRSVQAILAEAVVAVVILLESLNFDD